MSWQLSWEVRCVEEEAGKNRGDPEVEVASLVSGGQTGVDRAALDWCLARGFTHGGWCPRGRKAEDGVIPDRYRLQETPSARYEQRTRWNVRDSDATLVFSSRPQLTGGSRLTVALAQEQGKPWLHLTPQLDPDPAAGRLREFCAQHAVETLNVAGPRQSGDPQIVPFVAQVLDAAFHQR
jgi:hypothetical protein